MREFWKAAIATAAFGVLHSALAAAGAKRMAARTVGARNRAGLYRPFFILQSFASFGALGVYLLTLPRAEVYRVEGRAAVAMRGGQAAGLLWALLAARAVGIGSISGGRSLVAWLRGDDPVPEPEAQGPAPGDDGGMRVEGPFRYTRHPLNLAPLPVFWLQPVMTTRFLGFNVVSTMYLVLGSIHEEHRLERAYGAAYRAYRESGTPFYLPAPPAPRGTISAPAVFGPRNRFPRRGATDEHRRDPASRVRP